MTVLTVHAAEQCQTFHGRASFYGGDGQLRIWHIGTHHEFEPVEPSWDKVADWLDAGVKKYGNSEAASPMSTLYLFGDFVVCPVEPFKQGAVQHAIVKSVTHKHYQRLY